VNSKKRILKVKEWLDEKETYQFNPFYHKNGVILAAMRISDGRIFELGTINNCTIDKFHEDMINVTATTWVDTSSGGFRGTFTIPINDLSDSLALPEHKIGLTNPSSNNNNKNN
jgi:hypothetical protein